MRRNCERCSRDVGSNSGYTLQARRRLVTRDVCVLCEWCMRDFEEDALRRFLKEGITI